MAVVCAILGTVAMGMMFDPADINAGDEAFSAYAANGSCGAFQRLANTSTSATAF